MTRDEATTILKDLWRYEHTNYTDKEVRNALDLAIKALEQEPILDEIRAEIEQIADEEQKHDEKWATGLRYAVKIIDKYIKRRDKE